MTNSCCNNFVTTSTFVATNTFVMTNHIFCCDKTCVCCIKTFVTTNIILWQLPPMTIFISSLQCTENSLFSLCIETHGSHLVVTVHWNTWFLSHFHCTLKHMVLISFSLYTETPGPPHLVFTVVGDDDTHKQRQANHVADEDKQVDVYGFRLSTNGWMLLAVT